MPPIIQESRLIGSSITQSQNSLPSTLTEKYMIKTSEGYYHVNAILEAACTYQPDGENWQLPVVRQRSTEAPNFVCTEVHIEFVSAEILTYTATFQSILYGCNNDYQWSRKAVRTGTRIVDLWKDPESYPTNYDADWPPSAVVSGTSLDIMGKPETRKVWHESLDIEVHVNRAYEKLINNDADYYPSSWLSYVNSRNNALFLGYSAGRVAFMGFEEALTTDPWATYVLHFETDEIGHLQQRVLPNAKGTILLTGSDTWASKTILQADAAYWYQPFYIGGLTDFNGLWDFSEITSPTPAI